MNMGGLNQKKYENAILYFVKYCNNNYLGLTKLNKLIYYLDFLSYRDRKKSVTNDKYIHKDYGPVPDKIDDIIATLKQKGKLAINLMPWKTGHKYDFSIKKDPNLGVFDEYEKKLLEQICKEFELWSTDKIVNQSHLEAPWFYSKPFDVVDYKYSSSLNPFEDEPSLAGQQN